MKKHADIELTLHSMMFPKMLQINKNQQSAHIAKNIIFIKKIQLKISAHLTHTSHTSTCGQLQSRTESSLRPKQLSAVRRQYTATDSHEYKLFQSFTKLDAIGINRLDFCLGFLYVILALIYITNFYRH